MTTVVVLAEEELSDTDVAELAALRSGEPGVRWYLVVPQGLPPVAMATAMPGAPLGEGIAMGMPANLPPVPADQSEVEARAALEASLGRLRGRGLDVDGEVVDPDPFDQLRDICDRLAADELICLTRHHPISERFHRDWASRARETVTVPVVHLHCHRD